MSKFDALLEVYNAHKSYLGKKSLPPQKVDFDQFAAAFFCPGPFYYYVIDSPTLTLDYVSPSVQDLFGIAPEDFTFMSFMDLLHPDDHEFFLKCENTVADYLTNKIAPEKVVRYKITYCLRERTRLNGYRLFLLQTVTLQTTADGSLLKVFGLHADITHITNQNNRKISLVGLMGEPSYLAIDVYAKGETSPVQAPAFTSRELEIIKLLGEGYTTQRIAEMLFISTETVTSHRKNMLAKTGFKNSTQLLVYCIRNGLV